MQREDIDRSSLTSNGVGRLDDRLPAEVLEPPDDLLDESSVGSVEEPIQAFAVPTNTHIDRRTQAFSDPKHCPKLHVVDLTRLHLRDQLPGNPDDLCQVLLAPTSPNSQGATRTADPDRIHPDRMTTTTYPAITCRASRQADTRRWR